MKIHEFQAKQIIAGFGVAVPKGRVAKSPDDAKAIAQELGGKVVVKAQIHAGGRGKGGGVKLANSPDEAAQVFSQILGMQLVTHQTGPQGQKVKTVLVEEQMPIERELYLAVLIDGAAGRPVMMASAAGGMEIEEVAAKTPEAIHRVSIDPVTGFQPHLARELCFALGLTGDLMKPATQLMSALYEAFIAKDASLAEINPLVVTKDGRVLALDAKMNFDDNALFRHKDIEDLRDKDEEDPSEVEASEKGISNFIKLDGNIGCLVNGAGLAMATMDSIKFAGGEPANFLDIATANDVNEGGRCAADHLARPEREGDPRQHLRRHGARRHHRPGHHRGAAEDAKGDPGGRAARRHERRRGRAPDPRERPARHPRRRAGRGRKESGRSRPRGVGRTWLL